jgi:hypothetical protein
MEGREKEEERGRDRRQRGSSRALGFHRVVLPPSHLSIVLAWNVLSLFLLSPLPPSLFAKEISVGESLSTTTVASKQVKHNAHIRSN